MPLTLFLIAAIILTALYLRRFPLNIGGPPGWHPPMVLGPVGGGGPR